MTITELIKCLVKAKRNHGEIPVKLLYDGSDGYVIRDISDTLIL